MYYKTLDHTNDFYKVSVVSSPDKEMFWLLECLDTTKSEVRTHGPTVEYWGWGIELRLLTRVYLYKFTVWQIKRVLSHFVY